MEYNITIQELANKLFATFTKKEDLQETIETITSRYTILFDKIFILESQDSDELICTYNIDPGNLNSTTILPNTILLEYDLGRQSIFTISYFGNGNP